MSRVGFGEQVPFWHQKAGRTPSGFALWDYHVFAVQRLKEGHTIVWDLDTYVNLF